MNDFDPIPGWTFYAKETLFDISFDMGHAWALLTSEAAEYIMNAIGGSRALAELAILWADEFNVEFRARMEADPNYDSYLEDIGNLFHLKWTAFIAGHVADRMTQ